MGRRKKKESPVWRRRRIWESMQLERSIKHLAWEIAIKDSNRCNIPVKRKRRGVDETKKALDSTLWSSPFLRVCFIHLSKCTQNYFSFFLMVSPSCYLFPTSRVLHYPLLPWSPLFSSSISQSNCTLTIQLFSFFFLPQCSSFTTLLNVPTTQL